MTRPERIDMLRRRYRRAMEGHKRKTAAVVYCELRILVCKQLRAERRFRK